MAPIFRGFLLLVSGRIFFIASPHIIPSSIHPGGRRRTERGQPGQRSSSLLARQPRSTERRVAWFFLFFFKVLDDQALMIFGGGWIFLGKIFIFKKGDMEFLDRFLGVDGCFWEDFWGWMEVFEILLGRWVFLNV